MNQAGQPSRTSIWAAAARAFGAREPDAHVRNPDWLARRLLGAEELALLGNDNPLVAALDQPYDEASKNPAPLGAARTLIPRTHFIDSRLEAALRDGITQFVILGAGFDTRAYRFGELLKNTRVFEVDQPDTQRVKARRVREAFGEPPGNVAYVAVDFRRDNIGAALAEAGYRSNQKTFFNWEGVTMYLPAEAVSDTLRWIARNAAAESTLVFDYAYEGVIRMMGRIDLDMLPENVKQAVIRFRRLMADEPWIFGLPENGEKEFLAAFGLELRHVMGLNSAEAVEKYLTRADGSIYGVFPAMERQGYSILEASVTGKT